MKDAPTVLLIAQLLTRGQPPKQNAADAGLPLRFKHGVHTIFLFANPLEPFSKVTDELVETLRDRHSHGLRLSADDSERTPIPSLDEDFSIAYAVLRDPRDERSGWKNMEITGDETVASLKLKDNAMVAFDIVFGNQKPNFQVEFPAFAD